MKTRNAMQLKTLVNDKAKEAGVSPQLMLQNYMLERLIDRISRSRWRDSVIVKGGMLIGSLIGVERRTTKDLDTTVLPRRSKRSSRGAWRTHVSGTFTMCTSSGS